MLSNLTNLLIMILLVLALALWVDLSPRLELPNPFDEGAMIFSQDVSPRLGLDLRGGLQVLLEADLPEGTAINRDEMETARDIVENRTNAYGVSENLIQVAGDRRIVGEFPGVEDAESILNIIQQTGLLEFVDTGDISPDEGTVIQTDFATG